MMKYYDEFDLPFGHCFYLDPSYEKRRIQFRKRELDVHKGNESENQGIDFGPEVQPSALR
jgi:hypothetical protein